MRTLLGLLLGVLVRLWVWTLRVVVEVSPALDPGDASPLVLAFWHGQQMLLLGWPRRRPTLVMVSWSRDGALQSGVMRAQGLRIVRGSSSRGGTAALRQLARALSASSDAAFAVDGPRGPRGRAKPGAALAAQLGRGRLVPMGAAVSSSRVLGRTWDRFRIPMPFSRVRVVLGAPLDPALARARPELLDRAIDAAGQRAQALLQGMPAPGDAGQVGERQRARAERSEVRRGARGAVDPSGRSPAVLDGVREGPRSERSEERPKGAVNPLEEDSGGGGWVGTIRP